MSKLHSKVAVIEGKWSARTNISVKGLFDVLSDINFNTPHAYVYEMFCNSASFSNIVHRMGTNRRIRYLYIGAHGSDSAIHCSGGQVTRAQLKNALSRLNTGAVEGLFLGSCLFGHVDNGDFLLNPPGDTNSPIKWIAGYTETVDWIDSSVLDLLFWNNLFKSNGKTALARIEDTAKAVKELAPGLVNKLGFSIYARKKGPGGGIRSLLE